MMRYTGKDESEPESQRVRESETQRAECAIQFFFHIYLQKNHNKNYSDGYMRKYYFVRIIRNCMIIIL